MPAHILVVEDEAAIRALLAAVLAAAGYTTHEAADGVAALQAVVAHPPDVILLDLGLPGIGGWAFLRWLRARPGGGRLPVLVLSGTDRQAWDVADITGVMAYLPKPFGPDAVLAEVHFLLGVAQAQALGVD